VFVNRGPIAIDLSEADCSATFHVDLSPIDLNAANAVDAMTERNLVPCRDGQIANFVQAMRRATARCVFAPLPHRCTGLDQSGQTEAHWGQDWLELR
jgi:hypothetical protein